jgi:type II secretory pathway component PulC
MNEKPQDNPFVFDAAFLAKSVTKRYHLNRPVYATQVASTQNSAYPAQSTQDSGREQPTVRNEPRQNVTTVSSTYSQNHPTIVVKGIVWSTDKPSALIGNQIVREGGSVSGARVTKINRDSVEFEMNGTTWTQGVSR